MPWVAVALGGAAGALLRFWLAELIGRGAAGSFPWGTFIVNLSGAFLLAFLQPILLNTVPSAGLRLTLTTGVLGAYTTFSTLTWEALVLVRDAHWHRAGLYVGLSVAAGMLAAWLGYTAGQWVSARV